MEFITSTHLKQWADTKECQSLLPELMRRLICASVKQLNRLSFPSGDAVHMSEWAGADACILILKQETGLTIKKYPIASYNSYRVFLYVRSF